MSERKKKLIPLKLTMARTGGEAEAMAKAVHVLVQGSAYT